MNGRSELNGFLDLNEELLAGRQNLGLPPQNRSPMALDMPQAESGKLHCESRAFLGKVLELESALTGRARVLQAAGLARHAFLEDIEVAIRAMLVAVEDGVQIVIIADKIEADLEQARLCRIGPTYFERCGRALRNIGLSFRAFRAPSATQTSASAACPACRYRPSLRPAVWPNTRQGHHCGFSDRRRPQSRRQLGRLLLACSKARHR